MSSRNSSSTRTGAVTVRQTARRSTVSRDTQAWRGAALATVREGTPLRVEQLISSLEASGDIGPNEEIIQDELAADESLLEMDAELDLGDEDAAVAEDWGDDDAVLSTSEDDSEPNADPFAPRRFEIVVDEGVCTVPLDEKYIRNARTPFGQQVLYELESRFWALMRVAAWLTERRGQFLVTRDLWNLGCEALDDVKNGRIPVEQKSFLNCAGLKPRISEASLSRYIRATDLAWSDGNAPLDILFSDAAKQVWVASAVCQFVAEGREQVNAAALERYRTVKVERGGTRVLAQMTPDAMDLPTFIQKANMLAGTQWGEVVAQYGERMTRRGHGN